MFALVFYFIFFFFNDTATTEIYTLSLHDALPIWPWPCCAPPSPGWARSRGGRRSEEHTSELQSLAYLVCRLLLEKKKTIVIFGCRAIRSILVICMVTAISLLLTVVMSFDLLLVIK